MIAQEHLSYSHDGIFYGITLLVSDGFILNQENKIQIFHWNLGKI
jgi:hypothetical protein